MILRGSYEQDPYRMTSEQRMKSSCKDLVHSSRIATLLFLILTACATNDSTLQTARMVKPNSYTYTFGYHYLAEHDDDVLPKRLKNDFSEDYNASSIASGANFLMRRGFTESFDMALNLSIGKSSLEGRFALFNGKRFASAFGAKWVLPTFAIDVPTLYRYKAVFYNSYEILPTFAIYAAPHIEWKPFGGQKKEYRGLSIGMVIGKDSGIVAEASFARAQRGDDPQTYEQFIVAYTTGLDKLAKRLSYDPMSRVLKIFPSIGMSVVPTPSLGLIVRFLSEPLDYECSLDLGVGPIPELQETKTGLMTTRFFAVRARYEFLNRHYAKFGLARKETRGNFDLPIGWKHLATVNHGIDLSWEQSFSDSDWQIAWFGVYIPLAFLPHRHSFSEIWNPSDEFHNLSKRWEKNVSFSLSKIHKEF